MIAPTQKSSPSRDKHTNASTHLNHTASSLVHLVDPPLLEVLVDADVVSLCLHLPVEGQELADVEADTPGPDDRHILTHGNLVPENVYVGENLGMVDTRNGGGTGGDSSRYNDLVKVLQLVDADLLPERHFDPPLIEHRAKVPDGLVELLLPGHLLGHVKLPPDLVRHVEHRHVVPPLRRGGAEGQSRRPRPHDRDALLPSGGDGHDFDVGLVAGTGVDEAGRGYALEGVVEARLVARNASVDLLQGGGVEAGTLAKNTTPSFLFVAFPRRRSNLSPQPDLPRPY